MLLSLRFRRVSQYARPRLLIRFPGGRALRFLSIRVCVLPVCFTLRFTLPTRPSFARRYLVNPNVLCLMVVHPDELVGRFQVVRIYKYCSAMRCDETENL